jgi:hypothetical protein
MAHQALEIGDTLNTIHRALSSANHVRVKGGGTTFIIFLFTFGN